MKPRGGGGDRARPDLKAAGTDEGEGTCVREEDLLYWLLMSRKSQSPKPKSEKEPRRKTPTFLLELPLRVNEEQAKRIRGHLEAGRALYNAVLSEGQRRLRQMRADPAWQE